MRILKKWKIRENKYPRFLPKKYLRKPFNHLEQLKEILPRNPHRKRALKPIADTYFNLLRLLPNHLNSPTKIWLRKCLLKELRIIRIYLWAHMISWYVQRISKYSRGINKLIKNPNLNYSGDSIKKAFFSNKKSFALLHNKNKESCQNALSYQMLDKKRKEMKIWKIEVILDHRLVRKCQQNTTQYDHWKHFWLIKVSSRWTNRIESSIFNSE